MKLEKIYSPKKIYRNFYSFAKENSLGKNQILVAIIFIFFFTAIIALLKAIIVKSSKGMNIFNFNNGIPILNVFFMLLAILVIFNILITIFKWNFKLMLSRMAASNRK